MGVSHLWSKVKAYLDNRFGTGTYQNNGTIQLFQNATLSLSADSTVLIGGTIGGYEGLMMQFGDHFYMLAGSGNNSIVPVVQSNKGCLSLGILITDNLGRIEVNPRGSSCRLTAVSWNKVTFQEVSGNKPVKITVAEGSSGSGIASTPCFVMVYTYRNY